MKAYSILKQEAGTYVLNQLREAGSTVRKNNITGEDETIVYRTLGLTPKLDGNKLTAANNVLKTIFAVETGEQDAQGHTIYKGKHRTLFSQIEQLGEAGALGAEIDVETAIVEAADSFPMMTKDKDGKIIVVRNADKSPITIKTFTVVRLEQEANTIEQLAEAKIRQIIREKQFGGGFVSGGHLGANGEVIINGASAGESLKETDLSKAEDNDLDGDKLD